MRWIPFLLLVLTAASAAKDEESNEITPIKPPIHLDSNLRKALLKALTDLENEDNAKQKIHTNAHTKMPPIEMDEIERAPASALSFFTNYSTSVNIETKTETETTTTEEPRPIVVIQRSNGLQHKSIISLENSKIDPIKDAEQILTSASSRFTTPGKYTFKKIESQRSISSLNSLQNDFKSTTRFMPKIETTTPRITTSTEESEAKVEDVQFFPAPLVAAFTVHQDETGLPKSVIPILKSPVNQQEKIRQAQKVEQFVQEQQQIKKDHQKQEQEQLKLQQIHNEHLRTQFALQQKQKALEDEILRLKQQQEQHHFLIRQQQFLHEQQMQLQKQKLLEEEARIRNNQQPFIPIASPHVNQINNQAGFTRNQFDNNRLKGSNTVVTLQPSVSFAQQSTNLPDNAQHLPVKNAINFQAPFIIKPVPYKPFNFVQQQQLPLSGTPPPFNFAQAQTSLTQQSSIFRQSQQNHPSNFGQPQQDVQSSFNQPQQNVQSTFTQPQQNVPAPFSQPQQNVQSSFSQPQQNVPAPFSQSQQNVQSSFSQSQQNVPASFNQPQQNVPTSFSQPQQNVPVSFSQPQQNVPSSFNHPQSNLFSSSFNQPSLSSSSFSQSPQNILSTSFDQPQFPPIVNQPHFQTQFANNVPSPINQVQLNNIESFPNSIPTQSPQISLTLPKHNRVFRQELGVGNFGFNPTFSSFNNLHPQSNRFFRSNSEFTPFHTNRIQPPIINHHLNNLLYSSGIIRGKQHEDLTIVSKVLSLHDDGKFGFASSDSK